MNRVDSFNGVKTKKGELPFSLFKLPRKKKFYGTVILMVSDNCPMSRLSLSIY
jgi:hypothetical protein